MEITEKDLQKNYLPILKFVAILNDKGISIGLPGISNLQAINAIDSYRDENSKWWIAKHELNSRIKARKGRLAPPIEEGWMSVETYTYRLSEHGIYTSPGRVMDAMAYGLPFKVDEHRRYLISESQLKKKIEESKL